MEHPVIGSNIDRIARYRGAGIGDIPQLPPVSVPEATFVGTADVADNLLGLGIIGSLEKVGQFSIVGVCRPAVALGKQHLPAHLRRGSRLVIHGGEDVSVVGVFLYQLDSCIPEGLVSLLIGQTEGFQMSPPFPRKELGSKETVVRLIGGRENRYRRSRGDLLDDLIHGGTEGFLQFSVIRCSVEIPSIVRACGVVPFALKPRQPISVKGSILEEGVHYGKSDGVRVDVLGFHQIRTGIVMIHVVSNVVQVVRSLAMIEVFLTASAVVIIPIPLELSQVIGIKRGIAVGHENDEVLLAPPLDRTFPLVREVIPRVF